MLGRTTVILVTGKAGVGKSTFSKILYERLKEKDYSVDLLHFASVLKKIASRFMWWDRQKDERGRKLLQNLGTVGREYDVDCWVKDLIDLEIETSRNYPQDFIIIDDWRYPNEYDYLKTACNFSIYKVRIESNIRGGLEGEISKHTSENALPNDKSYYNITIYNDFKTIDGLEVPIEKLIKTIILKEDNYN